MKIYYWKDKSKCPRGNFGDELNVWLWEKLIPELLEQKDQGCLVGIGTLLNQEIPSNGKIAIFGSGTGYGSIPQVDKDWRIYCLRGKHTASALQVDPELAITDAALLVRSCYTPNISNQSVEKPILFIPHWETPIFPWKLACEQIGITYVDPCEPVEDILHKISHAKYVIAEAMHGAIVADSLRIPWISITTRPSINTFKWLDWCGSMQMQYKPISLYWKRFTPNSITPNSPLAGLTVMLASQRLNWIVNSIDPLLSEEKISIQKQKLLHQKLDELRDDWVRGLFN
jgi:succinoglycan biosynthesis protein ExoV